MKEPADSTKDQHEEDPGFYGAWEGGHLARVGLPGASFSVLSSGTAGLWPESLERGFPQVLHHLSKQDSDTVGLGCGVLRFYHTPRVPLLHLFENEGLGTCSSTGGLFGRRQAERG